MSNHTWNCFIIKVWIKKGDEVVICGNVNEIDKRFKEDKTTKKKTWYFGRFPYGRDYIYGWNS